MPSGYPPTPYPSILHRSQPFHFFSLNKPMIMLRRAPGQDIVALGHSSMRPRCIRADKGCQGVSGSSQLIFQPARPLAQIIRQARGKGSSYPVYQEIDPTKNGLYIESKAFPIVK